MISATQIRPSRSIITIVLLEKTLIEQGLDFPKVKLSAGDSSVSGRMNECREGGLTVTNLLYLCYSMLRGEGADGRVEVWNQPT